MLSHLKTWNWREKNQIKAWAYLPQESTTWNWQNFNIYHRSFAIRYFNKYLCRTGQDLLAIWGRCPAVYVAKEQPQSERRSLVFFSFCIVFYILSKPVKSDYKRKCEFSDYPIVKMLQNSPSSIEKYRKAVRWCASLIRSLYWLTRLIWIGLNEWLQTNISYM